MSVGVVIGRFQVDKPHAGHLQLIQAVQKRHGKVLILLGCSPVRLSSTDPLDYTTREQMMKHFIPDATILPVYDRRDDGDWSRQVDEVVHNAFPTDEATLYGSRKSFAPHYHGRLKVQELEEVTAPSGTDLRRELGQTVSSHPEFRHGVIYACHNRWPISYQAVDVAITRAFGFGNWDVLLVRKPGETGHRFPGGFVAPADTSLEDAARREVSEETGVEIGDAKYIGSYRVDDWRYQGRQDQIMTAFFTAPYLFGAAKAADDVDAAQWFPLEKIGDVLVAEHLMLGRALAGER